MLRYTDYDIVFQEIPDEVTLAINISNCPNRCKGCHSAYLMEDVGDLLTEESLSALLQKYGSAATCVCFMGGDAEPMEVERLARFISSGQAFPAVKVGWYSGGASRKIGYTVLPVYQVGAVRRKPWRLEIGAYQPAALSHRAGKDGRYYLPFQTVTVNRYLLIYEGKFENTNKYVV